MLDEPRVMTPFAAAVEMPDAQAGVAHSHAPSLVRSSPPSLPLHPQSDVTASYVAAVDAPLLIESGGVVLVKPSPMTPVADAVEMPDARAGSAHSHASSLVCSSPPSLPLCPQSNATASCVTATDTPLLIASGGVVLVEPRAVTPVAGAVELPEASDGLAHSHALSLVCSSAPPSPVLPAKYGTPPALRDDAELPPPGSLLMTMAQQCSCCCGDCLPEAEPVRAEVHSPVQSSATSQWYVDYTQWLGDRFSAEMLYLSYVAYLHITEHEAATQIQAAARGFAVRTLLALTTRAVMMLTSSRNLRNLMGPLQRLVRSSGLVGAVTITTVSTYTQTPASWYPSVPVASVPKPRAVTPMAVNDCAYCDAKICVSRREPQYGSLACIVCNEHLTCPVSASKGQIDYVKYMRIIHKAFPDVCLKNLSSTDRSLLAASAHMAKPPPPPDGSTAQTSVSRTMHVAHDGVWYIAGEPVYGPQPKPCASAAVRTALDASLPAPDLHPRVFVSPPPVVPPNAKLPVRHNANAKYVEHYLQSRGQMMVMGGSTLSQARARLGPGEIVALADNGCTHTTFLQGWTSGAIIPGTTLSAAAPLGVGKKGMMVNLLNSSIGAFRIFGENGSGHIDVLLRFNTSAEVYGNVLSEIEMKKAVRVSTDMGAVRTYTAPGSTPLKLLEGDNGASYVIIAPLTDAVSRQRLLKDAPRNWTAEHYLHVVASSSALPAMGTGHIDQYGAISRMEGMLASVPPSVSQEQLPVVDSSLEHVPLSAKISERLTLSSAEIRHFKAKLRGELHPDAGAVNLCAGPHPPVRSQAHDDPSLSELLLRDGVPWARDYDNDPATGGGPAGDIASPGVYVKLQKAADDGKIAIAAAGPPCSLTNSSRIMDANKGKEDAQAPVLYHMGAVDGVSEGLTEKQLTAIRMNNILHRRCASIIMSVGLNGGLVLIETPSLRSDPTRLDVYDPRCVGRFVHSTALDMSCWQQVIQALDLRLVTTEFCGWNDTKGRNTAQKATDFYGSPPLVEYMQPTIDARRCGVSTGGIGLHAPSAHLTALGGKVGGKYNTSGTGAYPQELVECLSAALTAVRRRGSTGRAPIMLSLKQRVINMDRPSGAKYADPGRGILLLIRLHVASGHGSRLQVFHMLKYFGWENRVDDDALKQFAKWKCAACMCALGKRRAFGPTPADATQPAPGKVWQADTLAVRSPPSVVTLFACVTCKLLISYKTDGSSIDADTFVILCGKLRALIRVTHGEIHILKLDPASIFTGKSLEYYAASEARTVGERSFLLDVGPVGVHEKVNLCENAFGRLVPRANASLRSAGKAERHFVRAYFHVESMDNFVTPKKALAFKTPIEVFYKHADPECAPPFFPMTVFGAPVTHVKHPEYIASKYDDHASAGWLAGVSRRSGPLNTSCAAVITLQGNEIAVDFGMLKTTERPVIDRCEPENYPGLASVMPDREISAWPPAAPRAAAAPSADEPSPPSQAVPPTDMSELSVVHMQAAYACAADLMKESTALIKRIETSVEKYVAGGARQREVAFISALKTHLTDVSSSPVHVNNMTIARAKSDAACIEVYEQAIADAEVMLVSQDKQMAMYACELARRNEPLVALPAIVPDERIIGQNVEVYWSDKVWHAGKCRGYRIYRNRVQYNVIYPNDGSWAAKDCDVYHYLDGAADAHKWRVPPSRRTVQPGQLQALTQQPTPAPAGPALTSSGAALPQQRASSATALLEVAWNDTPLPSLKAEYNYLKTAADLFASTRSDEYETAASHFASRGPPLARIISAKEQSEHDQQSLIMALQSASEHSGANDLPKLTPARLVSILEAEAANLFVQIMQHEDEQYIINIDDPSTWPCPNNEREYNQSPFKADWRKAKEAAFDKYQELKISDLVRRERWMRVLRGRWVLTKKFHEDTGEFLKLSARWCVVGTSMDKEIYDSACDVVRLSSWQLVLAVGAVYRLVNFAIDLVQAFQSTPDDPSTPKVYATQMQGFEVRKPDGSIDNDIVQALNVGMQGRIDGSSLLASRLHKILVDDMHCRRCQNDGKVYVYYHGPYANTLDEVMAYLKEGKLAGEYKGRPLGYAIICIHADDMPCTATSERVRDYVCDTLRVYYETKCGVWKKMLGRNVVEGPGWVELNVIYYIDRLVHVHWPPNEHRPNFRTICSTMIDKLEKAQPPTDPDALVKYRAMQQQARHLIGAINWASETDHRLKFISSAVTAYMAEPDYPHYKEARQALLYVHQHPMAKRLGAPDLHTLLPCATGTRPFPLATGPADGCLHALFDSSPRIPRALTGAAVMVARGAVAVVSAREKTVTTGAHAGETGASITTLHHVLPVKALMAELLLPQACPVPMYTDAGSVLFTANGGASVRKTPWLLGRLHVVIDATDSKEIKMLKVSGKANPVNSLTKYTPADEYARDMGYLMNNEAAISSSGQRRGVHFTETGAELDPLRQMLATDG